MGTGVPDMTTVQQPASPGRYTPEYARLQVERLRLKALAATGGAPALTPQETEEVKAGGAITYETLVKMNRSQVEALTEKQVREIASSMGPDEYRTLGLTDLLAPWAKARGQTTQLPALVAAGKARFPGETHEARLQYASADVKKQYQSLTGTELTGEKVKEFGVTKGQWPDWTITGAFRALGELQQQGKDQEAHDLWQWLKDPTEENRKQAAGGIRLAGTKGGILQAHTETIPTVALEIQKFEAKKLEKEYEAQGLKLLNYPIKVKDEETGEIKKVLDAVPQDFWSKLSPERQRELNLSGSEKFFDKYYVEVKGEYVLKVDWLRLTPQMREIAMKEGLAALATDYGYDKGKGLTEKRVDYGLAPVPVGESEGFYEFIRLRELGLIDPGYAFAGVNEKGEVLIRPVTVGEFLQMSSKEQKFYGRPEEAGRDPETGEIIKQPISREQYDKMGPKLRQYYTPLPGAATLMLAHTLGIVQGWSNTAGDFLKAATALPPLAPVGRMLAGLGHGALVELPLFVVSVPLIGASVITSAAEGGPAAARGYVVKQATGVGQWVTSLPGAIALDPAWEIPNLLGFLLGPGGVVKLAKGLGVKALPHSMTRRGMSIELDVARIPTDAAGELATRKLVEDAMKEMLKTGKAVAIKTADGNIIGRIAPIQRFKPNVLYHGTEDVGAFLKELEKKGYAEIIKEQPLFTSHQAAWDFMRGSKKSPPVNPGVVAIHVAKADIKSLPISVLDVPTLRLMVGKGYRLTTSGKVEGFEPPFKSWWGEIEAEMVGTGGTRLYATQPNFWSRFGKSKGKTGETISQYPGPTETIGGVKIKHGQVVPVLWMATEHSVKAARAPSVPVMYAVKLLSILEALKAIPYLRPAKIKLKTRIEPGLGAPLYSRRKAFKTTATPRDIAAGRATAVIKDSRGRILLVRQLGQKRWDLPGGGVVKGETPVGAMLREVREEVKLKPQSVDTLFTLESSFAAKGKPYKFNIMEVKAKGKPHRGAEIAEVMWWDGKSKLKYPVAEFVHDTLHHLKEHKRVGAEDLKATAARLEKQAKDSNIALEKVYEAELVKALKERGFKPEDIKKYYRESEAPFEAAYIITYSRLLELGGRLLKPSERRMPPIRERASPPIRTTVTSPRRVPGGERRTAPGGERRTAPGVGRVKAPEGARVAPVEGKRVPPTKGTRIPPVRGEPTPRIGVPEKTKVPPIKKEKTRDGGRRTYPEGTICWRQGRWWRVIEPPYQRENLSYSEYPPPGAKVATGPGSAFKTVQVLGGKPTPEILMDMGSFDVRISEDAKDIGFKRDPKGKTKIGLRARRRTSASLGGIRR